jgi:nicotinamidase-related amidase
LKSDTALLVIDVQTGLVAGEQPVYHLQTLLDNIASLIAAARRSSIPIIYIQDNDVDEIGSPGWQIHPAIAPEAGDMVLRKPEADAFYATSLRREVDKRDATRLILVGCKSEVCIDATCRRAIALGYEVTVVSDAHSTSDNAVLSAEQTIAYHNYIWPMVWSDEHGKLLSVEVMPTHKVISGLA